jgi:hypothetical protein
MEIFESLAGQPRHRQIGSLKNVKKNANTCPFCRFLVDAYELAWDLPRGQNIPGSTGNELLSLSIKQRPQTSIDLVEEPWYEKAGLAGDFGPAPALWLKFGRSKEIEKPLVCVSASRLITSTQPPTSLKGLPLVKSQDAISGILDLALVQTWLRICEEHHADSCGVSSLFQRQTLSLKLIDVHSGQIGIVQGHPDYIALSYVWGQGTNEEETTAQSSGYVPLNPAQTIKDAMLFVRRLRKRYLWVDKYCIDQHNPAELHAQVQNMDLVYKCAFLTIVAVDGVNADGGLAGISRPLRQTMQPTVKVDEFNIMATFVHSIWDEQGCAAWDRRAWTLQELVLSKRCLFFDKNHIYMRCREEFFHDLMAADVGQERIPVKQCDTYFWENGFGLDLQHQEWNFLQFDALIANFTRRELTNQDDALKACTGALNQFTRITGVGFVWGMPIADWHRAVLWVPHYLEVFTQRPGFPSWSWLGWKGRV